MRFIHGSMEERIINNLKPMTEHWFQIIYDTWGNWTGPPRTVKTKNVNDNQTVRGQKAKNVKS
jgi:hypothetical protein